MAGTKNVSQATARVHASLVREEDLQELEALKSDLLARADKARGDGRVYVMSQYVRLVTLVSPEIKRIRDRFDREMLAAIRKDEAALKEEVRRNASSDASTTA
jgi:type I restriction-modification system DNA methylase subunit